MGSALLNNWITGNEHFTIVDPALETKPDNVDLVKSRQAVGSRRFDVIVAAVKPQQIDAILPDYADAFTEEGYLLSIAAGCPIERLKHASGGRAVVRVMPNLPTAIGAGVSGMCASEDVSADQWRHAQDLMARTGATILVDSEDKLDRVTAVAGSGPGYVFEFARAYVEAAMALGFSADDAREIVLGTIEGSIGMARKTGQPLEELRNAVTSKNGTTEAGLNALNAGGALSSLLDGTLQSAYQRAVELR
jgi:pyrroline-5-carboxylate reductase